VRGAFAPLLEGKIDTSKSGKLKKYLRNNSSYAKALWTQFNLSVSVSKLVDSFVQHIVRSFVVVVVGSVFILVVDVVVFVFVLLLFSLSCTPIKGKHSLPSLSGPKFSRSNRALQQARGRVQSFGQT
jgi:hypothetical protein